MRLRRVARSGPAIILALAAWPQQTVGASGPRTPAGESLLLADVRVAQDTSTAITAPAGIDTSVVAALDTVRADGIAADTVTADTTASPQPTGIRLGLATLPFPYESDLHSRFPDPIQQRPEFRQRITSWGEQWSESLQGQAAEWLAELWRQSRPIVLAVSAESPGLQPAVSDSAVAMAEGEPAEGPAGADSLTAVQDPDAEQLPSTDDS